MKPNKDQTVVFHLAIPTHDLDATVDFYQGKLGVSLCRRYEDRVTFNFFGHQIVCHLAPGEIDTEVKMYPRHFGITFTERSDFDRLHNTARDAGCSFFKDIFSRFPNRPERHHTFFLVDPSNNLLEFKHYENSEFVY